MIFEAYFLRLRISTHPKLSEPIVMLSAAIVCPIRGRMSICGPCEQGLWAGLFYAELRLFVIVILVVAEPRLEII